MAIIPVKIKEIIENYIQKLKNNNFPVQQLFLFGSYSTGRFTEWSDIDLAVISEKFEGNRISDRNKIRRITLDVSSKLEVIPFNPTEFNNNNPLAKEIIETGIRII
ncbi:MAG: nucleotidyltransferase domain-containing protein [Ignavibacteriales bacterium]|nr:MAG: nucleotidyltransferase domain-containing protein [Ignavibacteriales bacterium]